MEHLVVLVIVEVNGVEQVLEVQDWLQGRVHHLGIRLYGNLL